MSRWRAEFDQHPFQSTWTALLNEVPLLSVDDQTIQTSIEELARLKKVIAYLKSLIDAVDVDITPKSVWDNFQKQAEQCLVQIRTYASNRDIAHIQNANQNTDNLLSYVKPYMVLPGDVILALSAATRAYQELIQQFMDKVRDKSNEVATTIDENFLSIKTLSTDAKSNAAAIAALKIELIDGTPDGVSTQDAIKELNDEVVLQAAAVAAYHNQLLVGGKQQSTKAQIDAAVAEIDSDSKSVNQLLETATEQFSELDAFNTKIFGKADADGKRVGGLAEELATRTSELTKFEQDQNLKHKTLFEKIESLLPGATSAGLASAYGELKNSFGDRITTNTRIFYGAVGVLPVMAFLAAIESFTLWPFAVNFAAVPTFEAILRLSLLRLPFIVPIVWLAIFASMRRSQYERLQQEYAHKEALAASYENYRTQLDKLQVPDIDTLKKDLIAKAIDAIAFNASSTLNGQHMEKMPMEHALDMVGADKAIGVLEKLKSVFKS